MLEKYLSKKYPNTEFGFYVSRRTPYEQTSCVIVFLYGHNNNSNLWKEKNKMVPLIVLYFI